MIINKTDLEKIRKTTKGKIVLVTGCFNLYHPGHVYFLNRAKMYGDVLIVAVAHDNITKIKRIPALNQEQRMYMVDNHKEVSFVIAEDNLMPPDNTLDIVKQIKPDVWLTNDDNPNLELYSNTFKNIDFIILERRTDGIFNISTSFIVENIKKSK